MRLNRVIKIMMLLANDNKLTVRALSEKFEVSRKTIYQDLDALILSGVPVLYGQDYKGTVTIMEGFNFPKAFAQDIVQPTRPLSDDVYIKYTSHDNSMKHTLSLWERFMQRRETEMKELDPTIFHSWVRCQQQNVPIHEVDPDNLLAPEDLDSYRIETIMGDRIGKGMLFLKVFEQLGWFAMIYDNDGILEQIINPFANYDRLYPQMGYLIDASEERVGTNSACLSLLENRTVMVRGAEHYNKTFHEGTCVAAPLYKNEERYGVLNISFVHTSVNPQVIHIVNSFARLYEALILNQHPISKRAEKRLYGDGDVPQSAKVPDLYGESLHWERVMNIANHFSVMPQHVAVVGESGVGKQSVAHFIHAKSSRKYAPCLLLNGACEDTEAWREEIFGIESKEKETLGLFEKAEGGVLIIRHPHKLPDDIQMALAQYLRTSKIRRIGGRKAITFDTRVIMTLPHLEEIGLVKELRNELVLTVSIQPLRDRKEDLHAIYKGWYTEHNIKIDKIQMAEEIAGFDSQTFENNVSTLREIYENNN